MNQNFRLALIALLLGAVGYLSMIVGSDLLWLHQVRTAQELQVTKEQIQKLQQENETLKKEKVKENEKK